MEGNFLLPAFENPTDKERLKLSETALDLFNCLHQFAMLHKVAKNKKL